MLAQQRVAEIVAALYEDADDALLDAQQRETLVALAEYVVRFASPEEFAHRIVEEEAENHVVLSEELRSRGRARRDVARPRSAVVRRLGALGLSSTISRMSRPPAAKICPHETATERDERLRDAGPSALGI